MGGVLFVDTDKSLEQVREDFEGSWRRHKFGVLGVHDLRAKMREKCVAFGEDCLVFEICNPQKASEVLSRDLSISTALPCRVSAYRKGRGTRLATSRPTVMLDLFWQKPLESVSRGVEKSIVAIMKDVAGGAS